MRKTSAPDLIRGGSLLSEQTTRKIEGTAMNIQTPRPAGHQSWDEVRTRLDQNAPFSPNGPYLVPPSDIETTRVHSWNASLQRQFGNDLAVSASYIGNYTLNLWDVVTGTTTRRIAGHIGKIFVVEFNADASVVASGTSHRLVVPRAAPTDP